MSVRLSVAVFGAVLSLVFAAGTVMAGGNSANAKLCQKGGWQALVTEAGEPLSNAGDCVSHAAQGGTLTTLHDQWQNACVEAGGSFTESENQWRCINSEQGLSQDTFDVLAPICIEAGGSSPKLDPTPPYDVIACNFF
jgi:hypothetical protein